MLRVKILINLQVGSVRVKELRDTLCVCAEAVSSQDLPGNHRGGRSRVYQRGFSLGKVAGGFVRPELTFSLVLTLRILTA